jgi:alpha-glucosidase
MAVLVTDATAQQKVSKLAIPVKPDVAWWSGVVNHGEKMPLRNGYHADFDSNYGNQVQPLLLSSYGEVIWSEQPFELRMDNDTLYVSADHPALVYAKAGSNLKDASRFASRTYFPPAGTMPDTLLFSSPQYNTWIELMYDQNQRDVLKYARHIVSNGFPPGVIMIDDNWQEDYGKWNFHPGRFRNPVAMVDSLHEMGFKVMVWVCPMVSPDCDVYRLLESKDMLLKDKSGKAAVIRWWNGASGLLDLTISETEKWFLNQLDNLQKNYHVDGFKFDAGDFEFYKDCYTAAGAASPQEQCEAYARIGLQYPLNEYRAMWKMGGQPLVNRLRDKAHDWEDLHKLIPDILVQGIMGYAFTCPDLIGGGEFTSFLPGQIIDQELIVRSAQVHALMPMMQFSVAPWRVLDQRHLDACKKAVETRKKFTPLILQLAHESATTGEPIVRSMEYVFPHQGFEKISDQFLLGDKILVAPVTEKGATKRTVFFPKGKWKGANGKIYKGGKTVELDVTIDSLPYFTLLDRG